jgi:hypothetical protein
LGYKSFFFYFVTVLFLSCEADINQHVRLFNEQDYTTLKEALSKPASDWQTALLQTKLAIETQEELPVSFQQINHLYQADTLKDWFALDFFYSAFKIRPTAYLQLMINLVDSSETLRQPEFYYPALFQLLESKYEENQRFALTALTSQFNFRYKSFFYSSLRRILEDPDKKEAYKQELKKIANTFDRFDKETSYYDSLKFSPPFTVELHENTFLRRNGKAVDTLRYKQMQSIDFFLLADSAIGQLLKKFPQEPRLAFSFIHSYRKIRIEDPSSVKAVLESSLGANTKRGVISQLHFTKSDSAFVLLKDSLLPSYAKLWFYDQLDLGIFSEEKMDLLLELFRERKLQRAIEKSVLRFDSADLSTYLTQKLKRGNPREQTYVLYFIGKAGFVELRPLVEHYLKSTHRNLSFEAEETIKRLNSR